MRKLLGFCVMGMCCTAGTIVISTDVPKTILDNNPAGLTSTLTGPNLVLTDLNFVFNSLTHTSVADLHIALTSPNGTTVVLMKAFPENGILTGLGTPVNFTNTVFDDQAATNLRNGTAPYTGSFNLNHPSVVANPLSVFNGQNAAGTWTLFISDLAVADSGTLRAWSLDFTGTVPGVPEPSTLGLTALAFGSLLCLKRRAGKFGPAK